MKAKRCRCHDCQTMCREDEIRECSVCGLEICYDCAEQCEICEEFMCNDCLVEHDGKNYCEKCFFEQF